MAEQGDPPYDPVRQQPRTLGEFEKAAGALEIAIRNGAGQVPEWPNQPLDPDLDRLIAFHTRTFGKELTADNAAQLTAEYILRSGVSTAVARATSIQEAAERLAPLPVKAAETPPEHPGKTAISDARGAPRNPLHALLDHMDRWLEVLCLYTQASTAEELQAANRAWLDLRRYSWSPGLLAADAVRNTVGTMVRWLQGRGRDDDRSRATIEHAAKSAVGLATYTPLSAFHYNQDPRRLEARWQAQSNLWLQAHAAFLSIGRLADLLGDHWERGAPASASHACAPTAPPRSEVQSAANGLPPEKATCGDGRGGPSPAPVSVSAGAGVTPQRRPKSVSDLVRFRGAILDTAYTRLLLTGYVRVRLDVTLRRAHGCNLPELFACGPELPRTYAEACELLRSALMRLAEFAQVSAEFPWLRCGDQVWALGGSRPDLEAWLRAVVLLEVDAWEADVLAPFHACSEAVDAQIDQYARQWEQAREEYITASDCPAETRLELIGALQALRSLQDSRREEEERLRKRLHDQLSAANRAMGSLSWNESAEEASRRRADCLLALGLEVSAQEWQDWLRDTAQGDPLTREFADMMLKGDPEPLARATRRLPAAKAEVERLEDWLKRAAKEWPAVHEQGWLRWSSCRDIPATTDAGATSKLLVKTTTLKNAILQDQGTSVVESAENRQNDRQAKPMPQTAALRGLDLPSIADAIGAFRRVVAASPGDRHVPEARAHAVAVTKAEDRLRRLLTPSDPEWPGSINGDLDDAKLTAKLRVLLKEVWGRIIRDRQLPPPFPPDQRDEWDVLLQEAEAELVKSGCTGREKSAAALGSASNSIGAARVRSGCEALSDEEFEEWAVLNPGPAARARKVRKRHEHMASAVSHGKKTPEEVFQFVKAIDRELVMESGKEVNARRMWKRFKQDPRFKGGATG